MLQVASVAIKGGTLRRLIKTPVNNPHTVPKPSETVRNTIRLAITPGSPSFRQISAAKMLASAATAPTERSMPPVRMTKVMPVEIRPLIATCVEIFNRLVADANLGMKNKQAINSATIKSPTAYSLR